MLFIRKFIVVALLGLCFVSSVYADGHNIPADISILCNKHGAVIVYPSDRKIYLGNACDAFEPGVGSGRWWYAASAFIVQIHGQAVRYANEIDCDIQYCRP